MIQSRKLPRHEGILSFTGKLREGTPSILRKGC